MCRRQADFCCHAATQSHSIIPRSIKRCGYPGRRESCLSSRSRLFFFPLPFSVSAVSRQPVPRHFLPPLSLTPHPLPRSASLFGFPSPPLSPSPVLSPPRSPGSDDVGSPYQGKSFHCVTFPLSFIFLFQAFVFYGAQTHI